ncbi:MAG: DUF982 domain-containing protein [Mesorhizobium sp.]|nr:DUF982 domain-containing protein [Mesorhizobium sp.]MCO5160399.1 DUF982 domain-containing protein [Mesorhizobium sp.]
MSVEQTFHEPVVLKAGDGKTAEIRTLDQALDLLREGWPETRGKWYYAAHRACDDAASGRTSVHIARRIFVYAVEESRLSA